MQVKSARNIVLIMFDFHPAVSINKVVNIYAILFQEFAGRKAFLSTQKLVLLF
jgi:hypothetical protein